MQTPHLIPANTLSPVERALGLLAGKWKCIILFHLLDGTARFSELRRRLPTVTQRTLTNQLRDLESDGLIERRIYAQVPARVEYTISPFGRTLEPILQALQGWGHSCEQTQPKLAYLDAVQPLSQSPDPAD
jgi:DNA-binding HxlR family transcriptional regulator